MKKAYYILYGGFILVFCFLIYKEYISFYNLIYSIFFVIILAFYKLMLSLSCNDELIINLQSQFFIKFFIKINEKIIKKNKWLIKPIYYFLYYFPTNWLYLIILWLGRKWWNIRLYINSNKDIIGKKYFNKNWSKLRSPLNYKYMKWFKKYIYDVCFRVLFLFIYFKINLMRIQWNHFFFLRIFAIIYSTILIVNNLHIILWLKNTDYISFNLKLLILFFFFYFFLLFLPYFNRLYLENIVYKNVKDIVIDKDKENIKRKVTKVLTFYVQAFLDKPSIYYYFYIKEFLLFLSISDKFLFFIDCYYNCFLSKNLIQNSFNINLFNNRIKYSCISLNKNINFIQFFDQYLNNEYKNNNDIIWLFEKNYRISFFLYGLFFSIEMDYEDKLLNYEIYKMFYGDELVEKYFEEELEEYENLFFIYSLWGYWLINEKKIYLLIKDIKNVNDIPDFFYSNEDYNNLLELSRFLTCCYPQRLNWLDYSNYFEDSFTISIIYQDIDRYKHIYMQDKNKFIDFWKKNNKQSFNNIIMYYRLNAFDHYWKINNIMSDFNEKVKLYYNNQIIINKRNTLDVLNELQEEHKKKYFSKKPIFNKSSEFLEKYKMKEEWKDFDKKNKNMFF